jgi:hypothetical protein
MKLRNLLPLLALLGAACEREPTTPVLQATVGGLFETGRQLNVGEVLTLSAGETQAVFLAGGENGAEYLYVPFNASENQAARLAVEVQGGNVVPPTAPPNPSRAPAGLLRDLLVPSGTLEPDWDFHESLRAREIRELRSRVHRGIAPSASRSGAEGAAAALPANPRVGDVLEINANPNQACQNPDLRRGRVAAVTDRAIVVEDLSNPAGGFTQAQFQQVGMVFDTLIFPVDVQNFGPPVFGAFIQPQNRIIIFYTRAVNELTEPGSGSFVGGFFFGRDLFPRTAQGGLGACPASNEAPIMYLLAPDPQGAAGNRFSTEFVFRTTLSTVAHEFQHLINQARRLFAVPGAEPFEEVWLNEGLSHIAEELQFYASTPLDPRRNIDIETLRSSDRIRQAFNTYQISNFSRYIQYLEEPDTTSLLGQGELPTRGASWAFLRYAADLEPGPDAAFFRRLVDGPATGVRNLANALPVNPIGLMQSWTVSVYTDDALPNTPFELRFQQPSWNFRSIIPEFRNATGERIFPQFPLKVRTLSGTESTFSLRAGGAAFLRFGVQPRGFATLVTTSGSEIPGDRLRISIVRLR